MNNMDNTMTVDITKAKTYLCKACFICDESVPLTYNEKIALEYGHDIENKICDKCKQAILYVRKQIEEKQS